MPAVINTNLASMFAQQSLNGAQNNLATSVQRLSSGLRINSAKDDAAGLAVAQNMQSQINAMNMASRNIGDATNMLATADASLGAIQDMLLRMKSLIVEGKNDSLSSAQRGNIATEISELNVEINKVAVRTTFNGNSLLAATGTVAGSSTNGVKVGTIGDATTGFGVGTVVSSVSYNNTPAATYTFTSAADGKLSLSNGTKTQIIDVVDKAINTTSLLEFSDFGISVGLTHTAATTAANLRIGVNASTRTLVVTNGGPASLAFQSGAANSDAFNFQTLNVQTDVNADQAVGSVGKALSDAVILLTANGGATSGNFTTMNTAVDNLITNINSQRATFGAQMNRVSYISSQLLAQSGNLQQSRSSIIDTDFAAETARLTKGQIMQQAATAMLAQANQMPNVILSLLK